MTAHTPLDLNTLSPAAQRALGPGPGRTMAARGMLPLAPADQLVVLYQLAIEGDPMVAQQAKITAVGLPEKLLAGTLANPATDPRLLDYFGQLAADKPSVFDTVVLNLATADPTIATLAAKAGSREIDLIAENEQRLLRHPEIITAMYMNRRARMSTIDRIVELAVRNSVRVPGLAAWDEVARALTGVPQSNPASDELFDSAVEGLSGDDSILTTGDAEQVLPEEEHTAPPPTNAEREAQMGKMTVPQKIRMATLGNAFARAVLVRDPIRMVAIAAIKSPGVTEIEAARYAGNPGLSEDVIRYIAANRNWTKRYGVKVSLCRNPKAPIAETARMLPFLREKDLNALSKSRGVPSALAAQARKLSMQRRTGK